MNRSDRPRYKVATEAGVHVGDTPTEPLRAMQGGAPSPAPAFPGAPGVFAWAAGRWWQWDAASSSWSPVARVTPPAVTWSEPLALSPELASWVRGMLEASAREPLAVPYGGSYVLLTAERGAPALRQASSPPTRPSDLAPPPVAESREPFRDVATSMRQAAEQIARDFRRRRVIEDARAVVNRTPGALEPRGRPNARKIVRALFEDQKRRVPFHSDPLDTELIGSTEAILCLDPDGACLGGGDCDDQIVVFCSRVLAEGIPVRLRARKYPRRRQPHVFVEYEAPHPDPERARLGEAVWEAIDPSVDDGRVSAKAWEQEWMQTIDTSPQYIGLGDPPDVLPADPAALLSGAQGLLGVAQTSATIAEQTIAQAAGDPKWSQLPYWTCAPPVVALAPQLEQAGGFAVAAAEQAADAAAAVASWCSEGPALAGSAASLRDQARALYAQCIGDTPYGTPVGTTQTSGQATYTCLDTGFMKCIEKVVGFAQAAVAQAELAVSLCGTAPPASSSAPPAATATRGHPHAMAPHAATLGDAASGASSSSVQATPMDPAQAAAWMTLYRAVANDFAASLAALQSTAQQYAALRTALGLPATDAASSSSSSGGGGGETVTPSSGTSSTPLGDYVASVNGGAPAWTPGAQGAEQTLLANAEVIARALQEGAAGARQLYFDAEGQAQGFPDLLVQALPSDTIRMQIAVSPSGARQVEYVDPSSGSVTGTLGALWEVVAISAAIAIVSVAAAYATSRYMDTLREAHDADMLKKVSDNATQLQASGVLTPAQAQAQIDALSHAATALSAQPSSTSSDLATLGKAVSVGAIAIASIYALSVLAKLVPTRARAA